jgi:release factor glutamine methyltransferase
MMHAPTLAELLRAGTARLAASGIETPRREARLLLAAATGRTAEALLRDAEQTIDATLYTDMIARRAAREPLAMILGHREFWSLDIEVSADTLIPRADSETLVEAAIAALPDRATVRRVLDLGTGTGCLLLAALAEFPAAHGIGIDRVAAAATLARRNATRLGFASRAQFLAGNWTDAITGRFDLVLSNPPYIESGQIAGLMPEVARHEPTSALDGGTDGLQCYRALIPRLPGLLAKEGVAIIELGAGQARATIATARAAGLAASTRADLAGIDRALILRADA